MIEPRHDLFGLRTLEKSPWPACLGVRGGADPFAVLKLGERSVPDVGVIKAGGLQLGTAQIGAGGALQWPG
jgi:hypothetical protein